MKAYLQKTFDLNEMVEVLDELPLWSAPFGLKLLEKINYRPGISALDIGFGLGFPLVELAMRLGVDSRIYGIDPWKAAAVRTRQKLKLYGISNVELIEGYAENIPLAHNSIDLIISNNGINNVENIDTVFGECARVIKSGGQFVLSMNLNTSMLEFYDLMARVLSEMHLTHEIEAMHRHIAHKRPDLDKISGLLHTHGFQINEVIHDSFSYHFATGTAMLEHYFIRLAFLPAWREFLPHDKTEQIFDRIETLMNEKAREAGCWKLSVPFVVIEAIKRNR